MSADMLYLSQEDVIRCEGMSMEMAIKDLEEVFRLYDKGDYLLPGKIVMKKNVENAEEKIGRINAMPSYIGGDFNMSGIKWIGSGPMNPFKYNLPRASAVIVLNDPVTMMPVALMDGTLISAIRTGAVTGICAKYLAPSHTKVVGLFGAGIECRTQLMAIHETMKELETAYICDLHTDRAELFAKEMSEQLNLDVRVETDGKKLIASSDIIVTATTAINPIVHGKDITHGCYMAHIGGNEVDEDLILKADKVVMDDWETSKHRLGDTLSYMYRDGKIGDDKIYGTVSDLVCGRKKGRDNDDELTYSANVGLGLYDIAMATRIYRYAKAHGIGQNLKLWDKPVMI